MHSMLSSPEPEQLILLFMEKIKKEIFFFMPFYFANDFPRKHFLRRKTDMSLYFNVFCVFWTSLWLFVQDVILRLCLQAEHPRNPADLQHRVSI